jgi:hypothetical protein
MHCRAAKINKIGAAVTALWLGLSGVASGQGPATSGTTAPPKPTPTPQQAAPIDLTGYWVSIVTEDWRWRMVTPAKGDYASIPINKDALKAADSWDPAKDEAAGEQCRSYGAPAIMRVPGRLHIAWQDPNTLRVETDAGQQIRLFHFGGWTPPSGAPATWQGDSVATWEIPRPVGGGGGVGTTQAEQGRGEAPTDVEALKHGDLKVVTTHIRPGYLRKNGVPYSASATLTEYWDLNKEANGEQWIVITTLLDDPVYLQAEWVTALHFKKEPDGSKWDPSPCSSRW